MRVKQFIVIIITILITMILFRGLKKPPMVLTSKDIPQITGVYTQDGSLINFSVDEVNYWNNLKFVISESEYPGETPDIIVHLAGENKKFTTIYNENDKNIFISFYPEITYGFLTKPAPGGWAKPLYKIEASDRNLSLLKIK